MPAENREIHQHSHLLELARPIALLLALLAMEETAPGAGSRVATLFLATYLGVALALLVARSVSFFE